MDLTALLSAFGVSAGAGLNAYLPLIVIGLLDRYTDLIVLREPWDALANGGVLVVLVVLALVEALADNVPVVNHINDLIQTFVRPTAGAIAAGAASGAIGGIDPALAVIVGILVAGTVHTAKATVVRPTVNVATAGAGNTPVSVAEDVTAVGLTIGAIVVPVVVGLGVLVGVAASGWWLVGRRRRSRSR